MKARTPWASAAIASIFLLLAACTITTPPQTLDFSDLLGTEDGFPIEEGVGSVESGGLLSPPELVDRLGRGGVTLMGASVGGGVLTETGAGTLDASPWTEASQLRVTIWLKPSADERDIASAPFLVARGVVDVTPDGPGRYVIEDADVDVETKNDAVLTAAIEAGTFDAYVEFQVLASSGEVETAYFGELTVDEFDVRVRFSIDLF